MAQEDSSTLLRALPAVDALLRTETARGLREQVGAQHLAALARAVTEEMREGLREQAARGIHTNGEHTREALLLEATERLERACERERTSGLRRVINASGVILHTNLGRAPLSLAARHAISDEAARYCTLEYELETGLRGRRGERVEKLLVHFT